MKRTAIIFCALIFLAGLALAYVPPGDMDINGIWKDPNADNKLVIKHDGSFIDLVYTFKYNNKLSEWKGRGTVSGSHVSFKYWYTKNKPKGWYNGTMDLKAYGGKNAYMEGTWRSANKKYSGPIKFVLVESKAEKNINEER